jgi:ADP-ribose pyrophosphatase YjhB (NUDIX family)
MTQKYAVYWNQKVLFFNNPQGIHQQLDKVIEYPGCDSTALQDAISMLKNSEDDYCQIFMPDIDFESGLELLKKLLHFIMAAGGIVETPDQKSLFIHRLGCWDLPKGKVEPNESLPIAAQREIEEETGISDLKNAGELCRTWHTYSHKGKEVLKETVWYAFKTSKAWPTIPQTEEDIFEATWKTPDQWSEVEANTYPSILDVLACRKSITSF